MPLPRGRARGFRRLPVCFEKQKREHSCPGDHGPNRQRGCCPRRRGPAGDRLGRGRSQRPVVGAGIRDLLARVAWQPADVDLVAVTVGPGSFTGLRIGVATAKAFAYAVGAEVLGIDTHEALALPCPPEVSRLHTVVDAQRPGRRAPISARRLARSDRRKGLGTDRSGRLAGKPPVRRSVTGPMLSRIASRIPANVHMLGGGTRRPRAGSVARLAYRQHRAGRRDDLWRLVPVYTRERLPRRKQDTTAAKSTCVIRGKSGCYSDSRVGLPRVCPAAGSRR